MKRALSAFLVLIFVACAATLARPAVGAPTSGALPGGWPSVLQLGMSSSPGDAARVRATAAFGLRSQYLSGGVNTGTGWSTWNADGAFVTYYAQDSKAQGLRSVFDYYMLLQSAPATGASESAKLTSNLNNVSTMTAYYNDLKLFFQRAAPFGNSVVLHMEPDLWGYLQQRASGDDAATVTGVRVASTGLADLAGIPDTGAGLAQAVLRLRNLYGPGVQVAYHASVWGTGNDILYSDPSDATVDALGTREDLLPIARCRLRSRLHRSERPRRGVQAVPIRGRRRSVVVVRRLRAQPSLGRPVLRPVREGARDVAGAAGEHEDARDE